jgi:hypothetical protein
MQASKMHAQSVDKHGQPKTSILEHLLSGPLWFLDWIPGLNRYNVIHGLFHFNIFDPIDFAKIMAQLTGDGSIPGLAQHFNPGHLQLDPFGGILGEQITMQHYLEMGKQADQERQQTYAQEQSEKDAQRQQDKAMRDQEEQSKHQQYEHERQQDTARQIEEGALYKHPCAAWARQSLYEQKQQEAHRHHVDNSRHGYLSPHGQQQDMHQAEQERQKKQEYERWFATKPYRWGGS